MRTFVFFSYVNNAFDCRAFVAIFRRYIHSRSFSYCNWIAAARQIALPHKVEEKKKCSNIVFAHSEAISNCESVRVFVCALRRPNGPPQFSIISATDCCTDVVLCDCVMCVYIQRIWVVSDRVQWPMRRQLCKFVCNCFMGYQYAIYTYSYMYTSIYRMHIFVEKYYF